MPSESDKEKDNGRRLPVILMRFLDTLTERFTSGKKEKRNRCIVVVVTALLLTFLITPSQQFIPPSYKAGDIATSDIRATQDYLLEDRPLTEKKGPRRSRQPRLAITTTPLLPLRRFIGSKKFLPSSGKSGTEIPTLAVDLSRRISPLRLM